MDIPLLALTFDLDDTLWPNGDVIRRAEAALRDWLLVHAPVTAAQFPVAAMQRLRAEVGQAHPALAHDLSQLRLITTRRALIESGDDPALAEAAFEVFMAERQRVDLYAEVLPALRRLAARFPLLALSNGNADVARAGVAEFFRGSVSARSVGIAKPDARIFHHACAELRATPAQVMHVGDDWSLDVLAARDAGLHSAWIRRPDGKPGPEPGDQTDHAGWHLVLPDLNALADVLGC